MKDKPRILVLFRPGEEGAEPWRRLEKAINAFAQAELRESTESFSGALPDAGEFLHTFVDLSLVDWDALGKTTLPNLTLVRREAFAWNNPKARETMISCLQRHPCLLLEDFSVPDLVRLVHAQIMPRRLPGVTPFLEKGALIVGEKIQSTEALGSLVDKLLAYLEKIEGFMLTSRLPDLRQALTGALSEGFRATQAAPAPHPALDFQVGASKQKLIFNLRFPLTGRDPGLTPRLVIDSMDLLWNQPWTCTDAFLVCYHEQHQEIEITGVILKSQRPTPGSFRSFSFQVLSRSGKRENLRAPLKGYDFKVLSDIRVSTNDTITLEPSANPNEIDLGALPEAVVAKLARLEEEAEFGRSQTKRQAGALAQMEQQLATVAKELNQKRSELVRQKKAGDMQLESMRLKTVSLEKKLEQLLIAQSRQASEVKEDPSAAVGEALAKSEAVIRAMENEKIQLNEKIANEQKRVALLEQKYSALYKDISTRDKELNELKAVVLKLRKEQQSAAATSSAAATNSGADAASAAKIKEFEARENALKIELRKLTFKIENHDKNVKAIQQEAAEKQKLLEQKLQAAKAKELELMKKTEELAAALKKAAKAA